jgi:hypothetical protein
VPGLTTNGLWAYFGRARKVYRGSAARTPCVTSSFCRLDW